MSHTATVIHLEKATERLALIENLKTLFDLEIFQAKDGSEWAVHPQIQKAHPHTKPPVSKGNIGCTHSHIEIIHRALKRGDKSVIIFEDDCDLGGEATKEAVMKFIHLSNTLGEPWDILLLGASHMWSLLGRLQPIIGVSAVSGEHMPSFYENVVCVPL